MANSTPEPAGLILTDALNLIETRGWDRMARPHAPGHTTEPYAPDYTGTLSVRGALEVASRARDWESLGLSDAGAAADDGMCALASYVIDTVLIPVHGIVVGLCQACVQCPEHRDRPLTLLRNQTCPNGCALCDEHAHLSDPHGQDQPLTEDIIDCWEGYMPHQRDVISGLRAAASRPAL